MWFKFTLKKKVFLKLILHWFYTGVRFSIAFLCSIFELSTDNIKKNWDKTVLKMWSQNIQKDAKFGHKLPLKKKFSKKVILQFFNNF